MRRSILRLLKSTLVLFWSAGCQVGLAPLDTSAGDDDSGEGQDLALYISSISPDYGPLAGGTLVTISGHGFGDTPTVQWGNGAVDTITAIDTEIVLSTPLVSVQTSIDVTVTADAGTYSVEDGFTYTDSTEPTGDKEGIIQLTYQYNLCPGCWSPPADTEMASSQVAFFEPTTAEFLDYLPEAGTCDTSLSSSSPTLTYRDAGSFVYLESGSNSISLLKSTVGGKTVYEASTTAGTMSASAIAHSAAYDLVTNGGTDVDAATVDDALYTAQFFDDINPDISGQFSYRLSRNLPLTWTWLPAGDGTNNFLIQYDFYTATGSYTGTTLCNGYDSGSLTTPATAVTGTANSIVVITLQRYETGSFDFPDGATGQYLSVASVQGTATVGN
jgi:hypothetical protein